MSNVVGIFLKFWPFFDARSQNMVSHVTQDANFKNFLLCPDSTFNIRKSHKISSGKALYFRSYQPGTSPGGGGGGGGETHTPSAFRVKQKTDHR